MLCFLNAWFFREFRHCFLSIPTACFLKSFRIVILLPEKTGELVGKLLLCTNGRVMLAPRKISTTLLRPTEVRLLFIKNRKWMSRPHFRSDQSFFNNPKNWKRRTWEDGVADYFSFFCFEIVYGNEMKTKLCNKGRITNQNPHICIQNYCKDT